MSAEVDPRAWTHMRPARAWSRVRVRATMWAVYSLLGSFIVAGSVATGVATAPPAQASETLRTFMHYAGWTPSGSGFYRGDNWSVPRGHDSFFDPGRAGFGTPTRMRLRIMGGRGGYGGRDGSTGLNSPGNSGYVETVWFSPREIGVFPGDGGGDGASYARCGGGGNGGYHHHSWDGGWGGGAGCRGSSGGGGGGGAASAVLFPGVGWIVAGGGGGGGGNGNFASQSWMAGRSWHSNNGSFTGSYGGDPGGSDGGGGGGGGGGWNAGNGGGISWVSWANEFGGAGGFVGSNQNTAGIGIAVSDFRWNGDWRGWVAIDVFYAGVPSVPTSLRVSSVGDRSVTVAWNVPSDNGGLPVSNYEVCIGTTSAANNRCVTTSGGLTATFTELTPSNPLSNGTTYHFKVRALNSVGWGSYSGSVSAVPRTVPSAPTQLSATPGSGQLALAWGLPTSDGGSAITDYLIQYQIGTNGTWQTWNDAVSTARTQTLSPLTNGVDYGIRVFAGNAAGWSAAAEVRGIPFTAPSAPTAVQATLVDSQTLDVSWTPPASTGGRAVARYWLERATGTSLTGGPTTPWVGIPTQPTVLMLRDTGLAAGTIYYYRVRADNGQLSPWSASASARVATSPGTPARPTVSPFACTNGSQNQNCSGGVEVSFPAPANGGADISVYRVQYAPVSSATETSLSWVTATPQVRVETGTVRANVTGLTNGQPYVFRVSAINVVGQGAWSENSTFSTTLIPRTVPGAPTGVAVSGSGNGFADLSWSAPSSNGGLPIENYLVEFETVTSSGAGSGNWTAFATRPTTTSVRVTGLSNGLTYRFRVSAGNASGSGPTAPTGMASAMSSSPTIAYGSPATSAGTAQPLTTPTAPTSLSLVSLNAALNVTAQISNTGGTPVTAIQYTLNGGAWLTADTFTVSGATYGFTIPGLTNGTTYAVVVRAVNSVGAGPSSSSASDFPFTTPDAPTNLRVTGLGDAQVSIAWSAPANNGGESVDTYTVSYRADSTGSWTPLVTSAETSTISGLTNGTTYEFQVQAFNARGGGEMSATVTGIPRTIPSAPTMNPSVVLGNQTLQVSWSAPSNTGGNAVTGYVLSFATADSFASAVTVPLSASVNSHTITDLANGTTYFVRVAAVNAAGTSQPSQFVSGIPRTIPSAPQNVAVAAGVRSVTATWQVPSSNGGNAITTYSVSFSSDGLTWSTPVTTSSLTRTFTGLTATQRYYVRVAATNAAGTGPFAQSAESVTVFDSATAPVITATSQGNGQATVRFDAKDVNSNGSPVTGYRVTTWDETGTAQVASVAACTTSTPLPESPKVFECVVTGLTNKESYRFGVQSVNAAGPGPLSTPLSAIVRPGTSPQTITVPAVAGPVRAGDRAISLDAKASSGLPVSYQVLTPTICSLVGPSSTEQALWGLVSPDRAGTCTVRISQSGANSAFEAAPVVDVTFTIWPSAPSAARITSVQATDSGTIRVEWAAPVLNGGTAIHSYQVRATRVGSPSESFTVDRNETTTLWQTISGLAAGQYIVQVIAFNETPTAGVNQRGLSSISAPETVTAFSRPDAPTGVGVATGDRSLVVTWDSVTSLAKSGGIPLTGFTAAARVAGNSTVVGQCVAGGSGESCTITGLANDVTYDVRVTASHAYLTSESSTAVTQTAGELAQTVTITGDTTTVNWAPGLSLAFPAASSAGALITYSVTSASQNICEYGSDGTLYLNRAGTCEIVATASGVGNAYATATDTHTIVVNPVTPGKPVIGLFRGSSSSGSLRLSWLAPGTDGGKNIVSYTIVLTSSNGHAETRTAATNGTINYAGLNPGIYTVSVVAYNGFDTSTADTATFSLVVAPSAPETLTATTGDQALTVSWQAPTSDGGSAITGYRVTATAANQTTATCSTTGATTCVLTGLAQDVTYSITVVASNSRFTGAPSTPIQSATGQLAQTITWDGASRNNASVAAAGAETATVSFSDGSFVLAASSRIGNTTARTGEAITYGTSSSSICSVNPTSGLVTPKRAGVCTITADQDGVGNAYSAAPQRTFTLTINQVQPTAPVRVSWTFTPDSPASEGVAASETGFVTLTYSSPEVSALGGGDTYTISAVIGETTTTCSGLTCTARFVFPSESTVASVAVVDTITIGDVTTDIAAGPWTASGSGNITLTLFRPDPSAPESVTAQSSASGTVLTVSWQPPQYTPKIQVNVSESETATVSETITAYTITLSDNQTREITLSPSDTDTAGQVRNPARTETFTVSPNTQYVVQVQARIASGTLGRPAGTVITTPSAPSSPLNVRATAVAGGMAELTWSAPATDGGQSVDQYRITWTWGNNTDSRTVSAVNTETITGLTIGTTYSFTIAAINEVGVGTSSTAVTATAFDKPGTPETVTATTAGQDTGTIAVTWSVPETNGAAIVGYKVTVNKGATVVTTKITGPETSTTFTGLARDTYTVSVSAENAAGLSVAGTSSSVTVSRTQTIAVRFNGQTVTESATYAVTSDSVTVTTLASGGSAVTAAITSADPKHCFLVDGELGFGANLGATSQSCVLTLTTAADSVYEAATETRTIIVNAVLPGAPASVTATPGNGTISVVWTAPTYDGGAPVDSYTVTVETSTGVVALITVDVASNTHTFTGLTNGASYTVRVRADNNVAGTAPATSRDGVIPRTTPDTPTITTFTNLGVGQVQVAWTAPFNGGVAIDSYTVTVLADTSTTAQALASCTVGGATTTCTIGGLKRGDGYDISVVAANAAGSSPAGRLSETTTATKTLSVGQPQSVTFRDVAGTEISGLTTRYGAATQRLFATSGSGAPVTFAVTESDTVNALADGSVAPCSVSNGLLTVGNFLLKASETQTTCVITASVAADDVYVAASKTITVTVNAVGPDAPDPVQLIPGDGEITVDWTIPTHPRVGGAPITGFILEYTRSFTETGTPQFESITPNTRAGRIYIPSATQDSRTVGGLLNGYSYAVRVLATNAAGEGEWDPLVTPAGEPLPVRGPSDSSPTPTAVVADRLITVSWRAPIDESRTVGGESVTVFGDGGSPITGYRVTVKNETGTYVCTVDPDTDTTRVFSCGIAVPANRVPYTVEVAVKNAVGETTTVIGSVTPVALQTLRVTATGTSLTEAETATVRTGEFRYGSTVQLTGTASSGLPVSFASSTPGVCSVSATGLVSAVSAGPCTITIDQAGDAVFESATTVTINFTVSVNLVNETPTVTAIRTNGATFSAAIPWAGANVTVAFEVCPTTGSCQIASVSGAIESTTTGSASASLSSVLAPNETYTVRTVISAGGLTETSAATTFTTLRTPLITTETPSLTALTPISVTMQADAATGTGTFSSWTLAPGSPSLPTGVTLDTTTAVLSGTPGALETRTVVIRVTDSGGNTGDRAYTLVVQGASPNLSITDITDRPYSPSPLPTSVSAVNLSQVSYTSGSPSICTINETGTITMLGEGVCSITVTSAAHSVYAADSVTETFTISRANQTITFAQPAARTFVLGETFTLAATSSSGLPVAFTTASSSVCTLSGPESSTVTIQGAGSCVVTAIQVPAQGSDGASQYKAATPVTRTIEIAQAAPTITLTSQPRVAFGETETVTATVSGNGLVTVHLLIDGETLTASETATISTNGTHSFITAHRADTQMTLRVSAASTANFTAGSIDVVFDLVRAGQAITIPTQTHTSNAGESVTVTVTETGLVGTITYAPNRVVDLQAFSSSGDTVTYVSNNPSVAAVETNTIYVRGAGTAVIKVDQGGSAGRFNPAVQREITLVVERAAQDLTVPGWQETATFGVAPIALNARNEIPGRGLTLVSTTLGTCEITSDGRLRVVGVETCTVVASDQGDANYVARTETFTMFIFRATRTLTISTTPPSTQVAESQTVRITYLNEQVRLTYTASNENDSPRIITLTGPCSLSSDSRTITSTGSGTCVLTVSVNQGMNFGPATATVHIEVAKAPQNITNIIKGTDPKEIKTPQLPTGVLSWTMDTITVGVGSNVVAGQEVARLIGLKADGTTIMESVTALDTGVVSAVRAITESATAGGLGDGVLLVTVEVSRIPTVSGSLNLPTLPESATSWAVTGSTPVGQVLDIGEAAGTVRPQEVITTGALSGGATSWRATSTPVVGATVSTSSPVVTVVPQARLATPVLLEGTSAWVIKSSLGSNAVVGQNDSVTTISGVRVLVTPTLPVGAVSWSVVETPTTNATEASTVVARLRAIDTDGEPLGETVSVAAGIVGTVVAFSETTTGLLAGAPILTLHSTPQSLATPLAGSVSTAATVSGALLAAGAVVAVVDGTAVNLMADRPGTVTWVNDDLAVLGETETVIKIHGETVTIRAVTAGTVTTSRSVGDDTLTTGDYLVLLASPRADSRNVPIVAPTLPTTAPETATYRVAWAAASGSAVLKGDTLTVLTVNAPDIQIRTPNLPQATDKNPAGASFNVVRTLGVGETVSVGTVVAVVRAVEANGTPFVDTIDVVATVAGQITSVVRGGGTTGVNELTTLVTMSYDSITVTSPEPGRVLTSITPGTDSVTASSVLAFVEKTLRFGERQLISATKGPGSAPLVFASVNETGTADDTICKIVPYLGGTGVQANRVGTCYITINQASDENYLAAPTETITISIDRAEQEVAVEIATSLRFGDEPITPVVRAAQGAAITLVSGNEGVFIVESGTVVPTGVGSASLEVVAGSTDSFNQSAPVRQTIQVTRGVQTISVLGRMSGTQGEQIPLMAGTRSGLTVVFTSATPGLCSVDGTLINLLSPGNCVIHADQAGDELWLPADRVEWRIQVSARPTSGGDGPSVPTLTIEARFDGSATTLNLRDFQYFDSSTVTVEDLGAAFTGMVTFTNDVLRVTPATTFSGLIRLTLVVTRPDRTDRVPVVIRVPSANPTDIRFQPLTATTSRISWQPAANAVSYVVTVNGAPSCLTPQNFCVVRTVLGPDSVVTVQSVGRDGVFATLASSGSFTATPGQALGQATLVGSRLTATTRTQMRALATRLAAAGYERVRLEVPIGPTERRSDVRRTVSRLATVFTAADLAVTTTIVKATPAQVRRATRTGTVPSASVTIRLVVPVTGPRLP